MLIQSSVAFYQTSIGLALIGQLYENNWGHPLFRSDKWEDFQLNKDKFKEI